MNNVVQFRGGKKKAPAVTYSPGVIDTTLNRALLTVQHCALVAGDQETASELLRAVADCDLGSRWLSLPGRFIEVFDAMDTEATYRAILGVTD